MKIIPENFNKWSFNWQLMKRHNDIALYEQSIGTSKIKRYILMIIQKYKKDRIFPNGGVLAAGSEYLPGENHFGKLAWQFISKQSAEDKYEQLIHNETAAKK